MAKVRESEDFHCENSDSQSLRQEVFEQLKKNPSLTAKPICKLLNLPYDKYWHYVSNLRTQWKYHHRNEQGSKCSSHGWRGWCYLPSSVPAEIRTRAVDLGWKRSRARNRWLLWKDRLGRLQWFETGRVNVYVRQPANLGKSCQLVCNAFSFTGLITDMKVLEEVLSGLRFKGAHYVFSTGQRLPKLTIDLFQKSNGIVIKVGDNSHPDGLEVLATYPDWGERNEKFLEQMINAFRPLLEPAGSEVQKKGDLDYVS